MRAASGARAIARAVTDSVDAARAKELAAFEEATERLAVLDPERLTLVQAAVVRALLEDTHPGGLSGENVAEVLERCVRSAASWLSDLDPTVLVTVLTGARRIRPGGGAALGRPVGTGHARFAGHRRPARYRRPAAAWIRGYGPC